MRPNGWRVVYADVHPDDYRLIRQMAQQCDQSVADYIRSLVNDKLEEDGLPLLTAKPNGVGRPRIVR
jgi:transcriptional accessory protein Tex/SPT6